MVLIPESPDELLRDVERILEDRSFVDSDRFPLDGNRIRYKMLVKSYGVEKQREQYWETVLTFRAGCIANR